MKLWSKILLVGVAAALLGGASLGPAPVNESPAQFVQRVFAIYRTDSPWWQDWSTPAQKAADAAYTKHVYATFYDPGFVKVMDDNDTLASAKGAGEDLDYDPVCQCQDSGGVYRYVSGVQNGAFFDAKVTDNAADQSPWTLVLVRTATGWRIWDVVDSTGSLRTWLAKHNACLRSAKTEKQAGACVS
jgi:hypothetical protein